MGKKILVPCFDVIMIAFFLRKIQWKSIFLILNQFFFLGGGGEDSGFQVTGMIKWGKNQHPKKYPDQKLTAKKSNAQFPSLKNFQKALNDNYNAKKYNHSEINWIVLTFFLHQTISSYHTLALPRIFRLFWIPQKSPLTSIHEKKYLPNYPSQKNPTIENFKLKQILWPSPSLEIQSTPWGPLTPYLFWKPIWIS